MARRKKSDEEKLAELLGIEYKHNESKEKEVQHSRGLEAGIAFAKQPNLFLMVNCGECTRTFAVSRANVKFCSDECRYTELERRLKIKVDYAAKRENEESYVKEVWSGNEPLIVSPEMLKTIIERYNDMVRVADSTPTAEEAWNLTTEELELEPEAHIVGGVDFSTDDIDMSWAEGL